MDYIELHGLFNNVLVETRLKQASDERFLQAQFLSRIGDVVNQIRDIEFAAHRAIVNRGLEIGSTANECLIVMDETLAIVFQDIGEEIREISKIMSIDFDRIHDDVVYHFVSTMELQSTRYLTEVLLRISKENAVTKIQNIIRILEFEIEVFENLLPLVEEAIQEEVDMMFKEMNYLKAEVFPMFQYTIRYFNSTTANIIDNLPNCVA